MAPEYATAERVGEKADVFSFGVVMLEILSGQKPFGEVDLVDWVSFFSLPPFRMLRLTIAMLKERDGEVMNENHMHVIVRTCKHTDIYAV